MTRYLVRRLLLIVPTVFLVTVALFVLIRKTPGDPVQIQFGIEGTPEQMTAVRHDLGLDRPLPAQYLDWLGRMARGDFGRSLRAGRPVSSEIRGRLAPSIEIGLLGFLLAVVVAVPLGTLAAIYRDSWLARLTTIITLGSIAVPGFFFSTMLVFLFTYKWRILPTPRYVPFDEDPVANLKNVILPVIAMSHGGIAVYTRFIRASVLDVLNQEYMRTARGKGLSEWTIVARHALRNALIPAVTLMGLSLFLLWEGSVVTERIFNWPGVGRLAFSALTNKDYPVVQAVVFLAAISVTAGNLVVDVIYAFLDPRISYGRRG